MSSMAFEAGLMQWENLGSGRFGVGLVLSFIHFGGRDLREVTRFAEGEFTKQMIWKNQERATEVRFQSRVGTLP